MAQNFTYQSEFSGPQMDERFRAVATLQAAIAELEAAIENKYTKPAAGIPAGDLDADVQSALELAKTAIQSMSGYYTKGEVDAIAASIAATVDSTAGETVAALPDPSAETLGKIYYVGPSEGEYERYVTSYDGSEYSWLPLGTTSIDLSQYATQAALAATNARIDGYVSEYLGTGKNLFNPNDPDYVTGKRLDLSGRLQNSTVASVSGFIPFTQTDQYMCASVNGQQGSYSYAICMYNSSKELVTSWLETEKNYAEWSEGVAYARFTFRDYTEGNLQIEVGKTPTAYEPYQYGIKGGKMLNDTVNGAAIMDDSIAERKLAPSARQHGNITYSALGGSSRLMTAATLSGMMTMENFPRYMKRSRNISAGGKITSFSKFRVGVAGGSGAANRVYAEVTATKVGIYHYHESETHTMAEEDHGLTINTFIKIAFSNRNNIAKVVVSTLGAIKTFNFTTAAVESYGYPYCDAVNTSLTDVSLRVGSADMRKPIWVFGDSYVSYYATRWPYYLLADQAGIDSFAMFGLAGSHSGTMIDDLKSALLTNCPKFLVWTLGMNESDSGAANSEWMSGFLEVADICADNGITLIAATIPNTPDRTHVYKNAYIKASGYRYIDFAAAVDAETAGATWYAGCLSDDDVHPTEAGAQALASQVLEDFPELMDQNELFR